MYKFILLHSLILNFTCVCDVYLCMCMYICMSVNVIKWMLKSAYGTLGVSPYLPPCLRQWPFAWTQYSKLSRPRASRYSYPHLLSHRWTTRITDSHYRTSFMWTPEFQLRFLSLHCKCSADWAISPGQPYVLFRPSLLQRNAIYMIGKNDLVFWT